MIKASEAHEIVEKTIEMELENRKKEAEKCCEELSQLIENAANAKKTSLVAEIPLKFISDVATILKEYGYVAKVKGNVIDIQW